MVLSDGDILYQVQKGNLVIEPFDPDLIQPASIDVRLAQTCIGFWPTGEGGFCREEFEIPDSGWRVEPGAFILGSTMEYVEIPNNIVSRLEGKSTLGRKGLLVHVTAGFIDPGFCGDITLEIASFMPVSLYPGMRIGQLSFHQLVNPSFKPYAGKYQGQRGATAARDK